MNVLSDLMLFIDCFIVYLMPQEGRMCLCHTKKRNNGMFIFVTFQQLYFMWYCLYFMCVCVDFYRHRLALMSLFQSYTRILSSFLSCFSYFLYVCGNFFQNEISSSSVFLLRLFKILALFARVLCVDFICCTCAKLCVDSPQILRIFMSTEGAS
jgi:hypothetical protein